MVTNNPVDVAERLRSNLGEEAIGIVGGASPNGDGEVLRASDRRPLDSSTVQLDEIYEAVYGQPGEDLVDEIGDKDVYVSGGTIANPFARLVNSNIEPEEVNSVDFGSLVSERRYPFTFDDEGIPGREILSQSFPEDSETVDWYSMTAEEFREGARPNYVVDRSIGDDGAEVLNEFESIWVMDEGSIQELNETQRNEYLSQRFVPFANGNDWQTDYSVLGYHENPFGEGDLVAAQGAHGLGTEGANSMITYPDSEAETESALEALGQFQDETGAEQYQALIQTYRDPSTGEITNNLVAVGEL